LFGIHDYPLFVTAGVLLNLTPGQDTMFILGRSLTGGLRSGIAATVGIAIGTMGHTLAAALGLSAILATSAPAFLIVKLLGAAYLIFLGAKLLISKSAAAPTAGPSGPSSADPRSALRQGILTNVLNPKVALFFLAFLPQFIEPASNTKTLAFLALGATFITTGFLWSVVVAFAAARLQSFFLRKPCVRTLIDRFVGGLFLALGARLAWSR
jgi:threonine/homoserine/homoserine lactone efflux protein